MKKVNELTQKYEDKKLEMGEIFKIEEFERVEKRDDDGLDAIRHEKKKSKFEKFDESIKFIEDGNWRVLSDLGYYY